jgi:hypothetical protein
VVKAQLNERDGISQAVYPTTPAADSAREAASVHLVPVNPSLCEEKGGPAAHRPLGSEAQESIEGARSGLPLSGANSANPKSLLSGAIAGNTEHALVKHLIAHDTSEASRLLLHGLAQTERDHKCIRRALFLVVLLFMLSVSGLGYCAILLPEVFSESRYHLPQTLCGLGLGSLVSLVAFLGYLLWNRAVKSRLLGECRLRLLTRFHLDGRP